MTDIIQEEISFENEVIVIEDSKMLNVPSSSIHIENDISLIQKKLWFELVYYAFPNMGQQRKYTITLQKLRELLGWSENTSNDTQLKEALKGLNETTVNWNIFNKDNKNTWQSFPLLAGCEIPKNSGVCTFSLSPFLEDRFLAMGEEAYVKIDLIISKKFQSKYALSLYCLALDYLILRIGYSEKKFSIEEIRKYLALKDNEYKLTADMNRWIIKPSEKEINDTSDMNIEIKPFKEGRKIAGYKLCMSLKEGRVNDYLDRKNELKFLIGSPNDKQKEKISFISQELKEFFIKNNISIGTLTIQDKLYEVQNLFGKDKLEDYLLFVVKYIESELKKGVVIKNIAGFFVSLLKDDNQVDNYIHKLEQEQRLIESKKIKLDGLLQMKLREKYDNYISENFTLFLKENIATIEESFIKVISTHINEGFVYDVVIKGKNNGIIDKTLMNLTKSSLSILIGELKKYQTELGYIKPSFESWKQTINSDELNKLTIEIENSL